MSQTPTIACTVDGPYLVRDLSDLRCSRGSNLQTQPVIALCRCGGSSNKPFCDGTHQRNGFVGARLTSSATSLRVDYRAPGITIHDDRGLCAHAGHCTDGLASVFKYGSEPWIDPAGAEVASIVEIVKRCPSGALSYTLDQSEPPEDSAPPSITVTKNGPYAVAGSIAMVDSAPGQNSQATKYTLCRCGGSKNKPFCDGSHWTIGFTDEKN